MFIKHKYQCCKKSYQVLTDLNSKDKQSLKATIKFYSLIKVITKNKKKNC